MKNLMSSIALKLLIGVVLLVCLIGSVVSLLFSLHQYLGNFGQDGWLQIGTFGLLFTVTLFGLIFLLSEKSSEEANLQSQASDFFVTCGLQNLGFKFFEGFLSGLLKKPPQDAPPK